MTAPSAELQKAIFDLLAGDSSLTALLGGARIYDIAPAHAAFPYVTFGRTSAFDWSTASERGSEHLLTLHVWSKGQGRKQALAIMEAVAGLVDDAALTLSGQTLVLIRLDTAETRYEDDQTVHHGVVRFRALVETG